MPTVPASVQDITTDWLTEVLGSTGQLKSEVTALEIEPIGAGVGLMGELGRLKLNYAGSESLPTSIVAKCAAQNENRQVAQILDFHNREADFYNRASHYCPLRIPESYYADVNQESYDFVLLMEDLGDVSPRDQLVGASREEAFSAINGIAEMHARWWGLAGDGHDWMYDHMSVAESKKIQEMIYMPALEPALENFSYLLDDETKDICRKIGERYSECWSMLSSPDTFIHGDYRQDNMLYSEGFDDALVMDWQISGRGKGVFDLAYFMCQSLSSGLRAEIEDEIIDSYVAKLQAAGIDYSVDECRDDYRRVILGCMVYPITVCGSFDLANERGKALGETMLTRNLSAIADLNCAAILD